MDLSARKRIREEQETEDLLIQVDYWKEKAGINLEECNRSRDKASRLVKLLEKENEQLTKTNAEFLDKFYEEKSKALKKLRELEKENAELREETARAKAKAVAGVAAAPVGAAADEWLHRVLELETQSERALEQARSEVAQLKREKHQLERSVKEDKVSSLIADSTGEVAELRMRCRQLETLLADKITELHRVETKLRNQDVLEVRT